ncbi:MAG: Rieske (2Fe-2S) protein [bacterium]|nr:MAG: Rieske (2Fe-2S) protein [bacterium]
MGKKKRICKTIEISAEKPFRYNLSQNEQIVIFQSDQSYYALENRCPHAGAYLHEGMVEGGILTCIWHGWKFDLETGQSLNEYWARVKTYSLTVENKELFLLLED